MPLITETNEAYHAHPAWSKSRLWRYSTMTPYRAEFGKIEEKDYFLFGQAGHIAVLEPERLDNAVFKATASRRGTNEWKANEEEAAGRLLLKADEYDQIMLMRDLVYQHPLMRQLRKGETFIEQSCYATDPETGAEIKCRPDLYNDDLAIIADVKFLANIEDESWSRDVGTYGYNMQDAGYRHVWNLGSGMKAEAFVFICISKTDPPEVVIREIEPVDVEEGIARYKEALALAEKCRVEKNWPGKPLEVVRGVKMRDRDRRFTPPQWNVKEDEDETDING